MASDLNAAGFCGTCESQSQDQAPGNISTTNGVGRKFYGSARPCSSCGSVIRTLWVTFADIPLVPTGSYRYKTAEQNRIDRATFWARKTQTEWGQVVKTYLVGWAIAIAVIGGTAAYKKYIAK